MFLETARNLVFAAFIAKVLVHSTQTLATHGFIGTFNLMKSFCVQLVISGVKAVPGGKKKIEQEIGKILNELKSKLVLEDISKVSKLPNEGLSKKEIEKSLKLFASKTIDYTKGKISGTVYHSFKNIKEAVLISNDLFFDANPLHPDIFPGIRQMEADIVSCVLALYNGNENCCGTMTSGGTESIMLACKSYRDQSKKENPEMIIPQSAHAAFFKASAYFGIKLVIIPVDSQGCVNLKLVERAINKQTILIVGSTPSFPHGIIDDIQGLSAIALKHGVGLHVDSCLGSFLVPFIKDLVADFRLPGVTSISCDTHKYGFAPKGSSVIMYSNKELCHYQYHICPDWMGGIYASPTFAGSRPGSLVAGCWTAMMMMGMKGYEKSATEILEAARVLKEKIALIPDLHVIGDPRVSVVAFASKTLNVYHVNDCMSKLGYNLNALQNPPAVHIAITMISANLVEEFLKDLRDCVELVKSNGKMEGGMAAIYGMAASIPDKSLVEDIAKGYIDLLYA